MAVNEGEDGGEKNVNGGHNCICRECKQRVDE